MNATEQVAARRARRARAAAERALIRDFLPPEGVALRFQVAGLGARFGAQLLDLLLTGLFAVAVMVLLAVTEITPWTATVTIGALVFFFIRAPYYVAAELLWNGQTLGKRISRLRVVSADGRSLRPYSVTVRNLMKEVEVFMPGTALLMIERLSIAEALLLIAWITILLAVPLTNRRRQRLGDMVAGTYVIVQPKAVLLPDLAARPAAGTGERFSFLNHQLDHYGAYELQTLERVLQVDERRYTRELRRRHERNMAAIAERIRAKIEYTGAVAPGEVRDFLEAFYRAQRQYLEARRLFGDAREDKFHRQVEKEKTR